MADPADIAHLLRRAEFAVRPARLSELSPLTIAQAVDNVLDITPNANPQLPAEFTTDNESNRGGQLTNAYHWWLDMMATRPRPIQERMTLFWHGLFTSATSDGVGRVDLMMRQNQLYRSEGMGTLLPLTQHMAIDPAMLYYLSNASNVKGSPNENFARELMELFTLGVGNYTEDDVAASARAWTGHNAVDGTYVFVSKRHDTGDKTFFGTTKNWDGPDIINEILRDNAGKRAIAARYIARKVWEFFAYPSPDAALLDALQADFLASDLHLTSLLRTIFNRPEFYSAAAKQGLVRSPTDFMVALLVHTGLTAKDYSMRSKGDPMGQELFEPPNVAGWKANAYWMNTSALSGRGLFAKEVAAKLAKLAPYTGIAAMAVGDAVDWVATTFGIAPLTTVSRDSLVALLTTERATAKNTAEKAIANLLHLALVTPEMHTA